MATESGRGEPYVVWMVFASLIVVGLSTLLQVRRLGPIGSGSLLPMFTAAFAIPFCITAVTDGGPATLTALLLVSGVLQIIISKRLFVLRRLITPTVGGTVMMILSITLASVVFGLLDNASTEEPVAASAIAFGTLIIVGALTFRGTALLRLWAPMIGIVAGSAIAAFFGLFETARITQAPWIGLPSEWPGLGVEFGVTFWVLLPAFLFLGIIISIQTNGESIAIQRVSQREVRAIDFREVQGTLAGAGTSNLLAGLGGTVANMVHPGAVAFTQATGMASRRIGYIIGAMFIAVAFLPKVSGLLSSIPGPVMTGYLILVTGTLFVEGARLVIQTEQDRQRLLVAGIAFWIGAAFQFQLFTLPELEGAWVTLLRSGITTGGFAAIAMILFLEFTSSGRMRFQSELHIGSLARLNEFIDKFASRRGWSDAMRERLSAVAEETLLTLAPLDLEADSEGTDTTSGRRLVVLASSNGPIADLEFIGGGNKANLEDQIRQLQQHDSAEPVEHELSLRMLRGYASSVRHQQYQDTDVITVRVNQP